MATRDRGAAGAPPVAFYLTIIEAIEGRQAVARSRARAVALYAVVTAQALRLPPSAVDVIRLGAVLRDIGMLRVPERVLQKPGSLTEEEEVLVRRHPLVGARMLARIPALRSVVPLILHHHEDWSGDGYPAGLSGARIPLGARIIRVADSYDALTSARPYRPAYPPVEALQLLALGAGQQYDPHIVEIIGARLRHGPVREAAIARWAALQTAASG